MLFPILYLFLSGAAHEFLHAANKHGTYVNPNPRPYERCGAEDLVTLSGCCNSVLLKLDDCKADDLACECCALQSIGLDCYNLCPGNPSANFLSVLMKDCSLLNDVNACLLPFKKVNDPVTKNTANSNKPIGSFERMDAVITSTVKAKSAEIEDSQPIDLLFDYDMFSSDVEDPVPIVETQASVKNITNVTSYNVTRMESSGSKIALSAVVLSVAIISIYMY